MNYGRELLKGNTDSLLLWLINYQPMYGYQIIKELEKRSNGYFQFKEGTLYPALHRLEKAGYSLRALKDNLFSHVGGATFGRSPEVLDSLYANRERCPVPW